MTMKNLRCNCKEDFRDHIMPLVSENYEDPIFKQKDALQRSKNI